jgi:opacity protein-like surface antigen
MKLKSLFLSTIAVCLAVPASAQRHELGFTLGNIAGPTQSSPLGSLNLTSGYALQANYGYRFWEGDTIAILGEIHFLANPLRDVRSENPAATRDVATLYLTPGVRVKFFPKAKISPYAVAGGGYGLYEQSTSRIDGRPNEAPRTTNRGVFDFGGGVDVRVWRLFGLRGEVRDFYTGNPSFNAPLRSSGQHNVVAGGGFTLTF